MKSIAIWFSPAKGETLTSKNVELHFNLWKIPNGVNVYNEFIGLSFCLLKHPKCL